MSQGELLSPQMPEEEAFCVFVRLMQEYRLRELFKPSMAELGLCIYQFEYLLQVRGQPSGVVSCLSTEGQQNTREHAESMHICSNVSFFVIISGAASRA